MPKQKGTRKRRDSEKYPGLNKKLTTRVRREHLDIDYIDQLNDAEKTFLNKFVEEELNSSFKNDGTDFNQTKEDRKKIYDRNNSQNRCIIGQLKSKDFKNNKLLNYDTLVTVEVESDKSIETELHKHINPMNMENAYVEYLEFKEVEVFLQEYDAAMATFKEPTEELPQCPLLSQQAPIILEKS